MRGRLAPSSETPRRPPGAWLAALALGLAFGLAAATIASRHGAETTYGGRSALAQVADLATGWGLLAAGLLAGRSEGLKRVGAGVAAAGVVWFAGDWAGWEGGPGAVRELGLAAGGVTWALVFGAVASLTADGRIPRITRTAITLVLAEAAIALVARLSFRDPFGDPHCWSDCTATNPYLVDGNRAIARAVDFVDLRFAVVSAAALVVIAGLRLTRASAPARRRLGPWLAAGAAFASVQGVWAVALASGRTEDPGAPLFQVLFAARCAALLALAAALLAILVRTRAIRTAVARVVDQLGGAPAPGSLSAAIGRVVGDQSLTVAYWLPSAGHYVDADGRRVDVGDGNGHTVTPIVRGDDAIALVVHDAAAGDGQELVREIGAAALLAVDNERLAAETRAQLAELSASRARIVTTADRERRRLERDLHDGAQQQLLALSYDLRMARARAEQAGDAGRGAELAAALGQAEAALDELRELAHGIYPAVLEESGLEPALRTLANRAPIPVELDLHLADRATPDAERAAYVLVDEAIVDAAQRSATFVAVTVVREDGRLRVRASDDGRPRQARLAHVGDRVGALRGSTEFGPTAIEAEIPCA